MDVLLFDFGKSRLIVMCICQSFCWEIESAVSTTKAPVKPNHRWNLAGLICI